MKLQLDKIKILRHHLRRELDPEQLRLLAEDLERHGQIQPIAVRPLEDGHYELIAGRRRIEAAKLLGWIEIEAHIMSWLGKAELPALAENVKRSQLSPLEESDIVQWMHEHEDISINEIAERTGHGNSWVEDRLAIANYPESFRDAIHKRSISIGAAGLLMRITDTPYRDYLLHLAKVNGATVEQCEAWWLDWTARQKLIAAQDWNSDIPQLPPLPDPPPFRCFLCAESKPTCERVTVSVCAECVHAVQQMESGAVVGGSK